MDGVTNGYSIHCATLHISLALHAGLSAIRGWHIAYQSMFHTLCYVEIKFCVDCSSSHAFYVLSGQLSGPQFV
jgi:hypothetical protein